MKKISVDRSSFEDLRNMDCIYVDKTAYLYDLVGDKSTSYYFISRPRRYGKSLMCSTLCALFEGKRELFKGLYIDSTDYSFEKYPVLHFNFAGYSVKSYEAFLNDFQTSIISEAEKNGVKVEKSEPSSMLTSFLSGIDRKAVIIVDEYDSPIIHTYKDAEKADNIRDTLSTFYAVIKNTDSKIRFFFLTGITKFSNMSIFSQMNNLIDLTFERNYASAFGYTEEELETYFSEYIDAYMKSDDREYDNREDFLSTVRDYYDGYRFSYRSGERVYNPVSVGRFFMSGCYFEPYWENTGASTLAVELARDYHLERIISQNPSLPLSAVNTFDYSLLRERKLKESQVLALLLFTGYLTIADGSPEGLTLTFPNTEIRKTFTQNLVERFTGIESGIYAMEGVKAVRERSTARLTKVFNAFLEEFPYTILGKKEKSYQTAFYSFFLMIGGARIDAEEASLNGRSDIVLSTNRDVFIIEMKVDDSVDDALNQIKTRGYYHKYINTEKTIHIIGLDFSSRSRQIAKWKEEIIDKRSEPGCLG